MHSCRGMLAELEGDSGRSSRSRQAWQISLLRFPVQIATPCSHSLTQLLKQQLAHHCQHALPQQDPRPALAASRPARPSSHTLVASAPSSSCCAPQTALTQHGCLTQAGVHTGHTCRVPDKQTSGSVVSAKPAQRARVMEAPSRRPRYWLALMMTVGSSRILRGLSESHWLPCACRSACSGSAGPQPLITMTGWP